ncbi:hypothetical protein NDU88_011217 [Pleurodeles waltl]|uniref:Uncharacterized protein n=1 Tax=Pleurodeles waltl TaxID=8319 RepID=A0AAV7PXT8_PLEWA|nr:hypothetical protein NDU88_011217 [Pleurodeles waltl]
MVRTAVPARKKPRRCWRDTDQPDGKCTKKRTVTGKELLLLVEMKWRNPTRLVSPRGAAERDTLEHIGKRADVWTNRKSGERDEDERRTPSRNSNDRHSGPARNQRGAGPSGKYYQGMLGWRTGQRKHHRGRPRQLVERHRKKRRDLARPSRYETVYAVRLAI